MALISIPQLSKRLALVVAYHTFLGAVVLFNSVALNTLQPFIVPFAVASAHAHYGSDADTDGETMAWIWSLLVVSFNVGFLISYLAARALFDRLGRRDTVIFVRDAVFLASLAIQIGGYFLFSIELFCVGRILGGVASGIHAWGTMVFLMECAPDEIRGGCSIFTISGMMFWGLLAAILAMPLFFGTHEKWPYYFLVPIPITLLHLALGCYLPKSPKHLYITLGDTEQAIRSIRFYHGADVDTADVLEKFDDEALLASQHSSLAEVLSKRHLRWPLILITMLALTPVLSGEHVDSEFSNPVGQLVGLTQAQTMTVGIFIQMTRWMVSLTAAPVVIERAGRRKLVLWAFVLVSMTTAGMYILLEWLPPDELFTKLSVFLVALPLCVGTGLGLGHMSHLLVGELAPQSCRATILQTAGLVAQMVNFVSLLLFPPLLTAYRGNTFLIFVFTSCCLITFFWFHLPETKGRSVGEIAELWMLPEDEPLLHSVSLQESISYAE